MPQPSVPQPIATPARAISTIAVLLALWPVGGPVALAQAPTPTATEAQAPTGIVRIQSPRPDTTVVIDNEEVGLAPVTRYLPAGPHTVRMTTNWAQPFVRRIEVVPGATVDVVATFLPGNGSVEFLVDPPGATVTLDGKETVPTPVRLSDIAPGRHAYKLMAPQHEPRSGTFTFVEGRNLLVVEELASSAGIVSVSSSPPGAEVWLDGEPVGSTPLELRGVEPAVHQVRVSADGYATVLRTLDTLDGSRGELEVRLLEEGGTLVVHTGASDATVMVDDHRVGTGAKVRFGPLERGRYELRVTAPGMADASTRASVPSSGKLHFLAELEPAGGASDLDERRPLTRRWTFWTAVGAGAAGAGVGTWALANALTPDPAPVGDVVVVLP